MLKNFMSNKKSMSIRFDRDLIARINAWRDRQPVSPTFTAVVMQAVEQFLADPDPGSK